MRKLKNCLKNVNQKRKEENLRRRDGSVHSLNGLAAASTQKLRNLSKKELLEDSGSTGKTEAKRKHLRTDLDLSRGYRYYEIIEETAAGH